MHHTALFLEHIDFYKITYSMRSVVFGPHYKKVLIIRYLLCRTLINKDKDQGLGLVFIFIKYTTFQNWLIFILVISNK